MICNASGVWGSCTLESAPGIQGLCPGHLSQVEKRGYVWCAVTSKVKPSKTGGISVTQRNPPGTLCSAQGEGWVCDREASPYTRYCTLHKEHLRGTGVVKPHSKRSREEVLYRDGAGRKQCTKCREWQPEASFYTAKHTSDGFQPECIDCYIFRGVSRRFNISREEYLSRVDEQGGVCAICKGVNPGGRKLAVDHDHSCCEGELSCGSCIRGLLCSRCNTALGLARDDTDVLFEMIEYLNRWRN